MGSSPSLATKGPTSLEKIYAYVLKSETTSNFYKGHTSNIESRLRQHNQGKTKSTRYGVPWKVVYYETFESRVDAIKRERYFKTAAGRRWLKEKLKS